MRWVVGMMAVMFTYAVASEQMPNFAESARPTVVLLVVAMSVMGLSRAND